MKVMVGQPQHNHEQGQHKAGARVCKSFLGSNNIYKIDASISTNAFIRKNNFVKKQLFCNSEKH